MNGIVMMMRWGTVKVATMINGDSLLSLSSLRMDNNIVKRFLLLESHPATEIDLKVLRLF